MSNIKALAESKQLNEVNYSNNIHSMYDRLMRGFDMNGIAMTLESSEDGSFHMLYAPGYEDMGVGDIVAQCK